MRETGNRRNFERKYLDRSFSVETNSCYNSPQYTFIPPVSSCLLQTCVDGKFIMEKRNLREMTEVIDECMQKREREREREKEDRSNGTPLQLIASERNQAKTHNPKKSSNFKNNKPWSHKNFLQQNTPHTYRF